MNEPDKWLVLKIGDYYRVFVTYYGGYLGNDSWGLNSGVESTTEDEYFYYFKGFSGSVYKCRKGSYGTNSYSGSILSDNLDNNAGVVVLSEEEVRLLVDKHFKK